MGGDTFSWNPRAWDWSSRDKTAMKDSIADQKNEEEKAQKAAAQAALDADAQVAKDEEQKTARLVGAMQTLYTSPTGVLGGAKTATRKLLS